MNRLRVIIISLLVLVAVAGALPVTESLAKWSRRSAASRHKRYRKHSRAWWRRHRALMRARRERAELRRRRARTRRPAGPFEPAAKQSGPAVNTSLLSFGEPAAPAAAPAAKLAPAGARAAVARTSLLPFGFTAPHNWTPARKGRAGSAVFAIAAPDGRSAGTAVVAPVSLSAAELAGSPAGSKTKTVGGLPITALRRTVIDRMVAEGGWVTNDFVQEMHGRRVFVVQAQTGTPGAPAQAWSFYFTEVDGRVYSLATTAPQEFAAPLAAGSEQFMASLQPAASRSTASQ